jgi:hypothetical protein
MEEQLTATSNISMMGAIMLNWFSAEERMWQGSGVEDTWQPSLDHKLATQAGDMV